MSLSNLDDFDQWVNQPNVVYILFPDFPGHSLVQNEKVKKLIQRGINIVSGFLSDNWHELRKIITLEVPLDKLFFWDE